MFLFLKFQQLKEKLSSLVWGPGHFCFIPFSHQKMSLSKAYEILSDPHLRWRHFNYGQFSIELKFCIKCLIIWILDTLKLNLQPLGSWLRMSSFPILEIILICAQTYNCYLFLLITWINWRWGASYALGGHSLDKLCILPMLTRSCWEEGGVLHKCELLRLQDGVPGFDKHWAFLRREEMGRRQEGRGAEAQNACEPPLCISWIIYNLYFCVLDCPNYSF